jgi:hypothetical protein
MSPQSPNVRRGPVTPLAGKKVQVETKIRLVPLVPAQPERQSLLVGDVGSWYKLTGVFTSFPVNPVCWC